MSILKKRCALALCFIPFLFGCYERIELSLTINPETKMIEKAIYKADDEKPSALNGSNLKSLNAATVVGKTKTQIDFLKEKDLYAEFLLGITMTAPFYTKEGRAAYEKQYGGKLPESIPFILKPDVLKKKVKAVNLQVAGTKYHFKKNKDGAWELNMVRLYTNGRVQKFAKEYNEATSNALSFKKVKAPEPMPIFLNIHYGNPGLFSWIGSLFKKEAKE